MQPQEQQAQEAEKKEGETEEESSPFPLLDLPHEVLVGVAKQIPYYESLPLIMTCKKLREAYKAVDKEMKEAACRRLKLVHLESRKDLNGKDCLLLGKVGDRQMVQMRKTGEIVKAKTKNVMLAKAMQTDKTYDSMLSYYYDSDAPVTKAWIKWYWSLKMTKMTSKNEKKAKKSKKGKLGSSSSDPWKNMYNSFTGAGIPTPSSDPESQVAEKKKLLTLLAARRGFTDILCWLRDEGCELDDWAVRGAANGGRIAVLQWLKDQGVDHMKSSCSPANDAAAGGHVEALVWLKEQGHFFGEETMNEAAAYGRLQVLRWLVEQGVQISDENIKKAVSYAHFHVLKWVKEQRGAGIFDPRLSGVAAVAGQLEVLQWLKKEILPVSAMCPTTSHFAALGGHLEVLQWLKDEGMRFGENTCIGAVQGGELETLKWLREQGCPWNVHVVLKDAYRYSHPVCAEWIESVMTKAEFLDYIETPGLQYRGQRQYCFLYKKSDDPRKKSKDFGVRQVMYTPDPEWPIDLKTIEKILL